MGYGFFINRDKQSEAEQNTRYSDRVECDVRSLARGGCLVRAGEGRGGGRDEFGSAL